MMTIKLKCYDDGDDFGDKTVMLDEGDEDDKTMGWRWLCQWCWWGGDDNDADGDSDRVKNRQLNFIVDFKF